MSRILFTGGVSRPTPRGRLRGLAWGLQAQTQGEVEGSGQGGSPGPHPEGRLKGLAGGGLQAHTRGKVEGSDKGVSRPTPRGRSRGLATGVSRPTPRGAVQAQAQGCIPACTEADPPPQQTATAAGGMYPTGMHSCRNCNGLRQKRKWKRRRYKIIFRVLPKNGKNGIEKMITILSAPQFKIRKKEYPQIF